MDTLPCDILDEIYKNKFQLDYNDVIKQYKAKMAYNKCILELQFVFADIRSYIYNNVLSVKNRLVYERNFYPKARTILFQVKKRNFIKSYCVCMERVFIMNNKRCSVMMLREHNFISPERQHTAYLANGTLIN